MAEGLAWADVDETYRAEVEGMRAAAQKLYALMAEHLRSEAERTGAEIELMAPGSVLPKTGSSGKELSRFINMTCAPLFLGRFFLPMATIGRPGALPRPS